MNGLKNIAGNDVSIFLFRFDLKKGNRIEFVVNEAIQKDMYQEIDNRIKPLAHACCETLARYRNYSVSDTIMDCNVLDTGEVEVMLSRGLGKYLIESEKANLFNDSEKISILLHEVMERRTEELHKGRNEVKHEIIPLTQDAIKKGIEELGQEKYNIAELERMAEGRPKPKLKQLRPEELPEGVTPSKGYDHRGHCLIFTHNVLGELGRIILIGMGRETLIQSDLNLGQGKLSDPNVIQKKAVFEKVIEVVSKRFEENFPSK